MNGHFDTAMCGSRIQKRALALVGLHLSNDLRHRISPESLCAYVSFTTSLDDRVTVLHLLA